MGELPYIITVKFTILENFTRVKYESKWGEKTVEILVKLYRAIIYYT